MVLTAILLFDGIFIRVRDKLDVVRSTTRCVLLLFLSFSTYGGSVRKASTLGILGTMSPVNALSPKWISTRPTEDGIQKMNPDGISVCGPSQQ